MLKKYIKNPYRVFVSLASTGIFRGMKDEIYLKLMYKGIMGESLRLDNPTTFNEKIQWLKLYNRKKEYIIMVDKCSVKQYIANKIGDKYVTENLGVWNDFEEIDFDKLPNAFVLKTTHDSGGVLICKDKTNLDINKARRILKASLKHNYYNWGREWPYKDVKRRIIAEKYMENGKEGLHDYKIWCFNGEPIYIQYITGRVGKATYERFYDVNWNPQEFTYHNSKLEAEVNCPKNLDEMLDISRKLSKNIPFLRVDLYLLNDDTIKFGELTFFPMSGFEHWKPENLEKEMGSLIDLSEINPLC